MEGWVVAYRVHDASRIAAIFQFVVAGVESQRLHDVGAGTQEFSV